MFKRILIATDGSELAQKAVDQGLALARALRAEVVVVHVTASWTSMPVSDLGLAFPPQDYDRIASESAHNVLSAVAAAASEIGIFCETLHVRDRLPAQGILETASAVKASLIVLSSHGRSGFARLLLGSEANEVVNHSTVPVLICR
jgi:nucleotide-binding universal stress UspA family protein